MQSDALHATAAETAALVEQQKVTPSTTPSTPGGGGGDAGADAALIEDQQETADQVLESAKSDRSLLYVRLLLLAVTAVGSALIGYYAYSIIDSAETSQFQSSLANEVRSLSTVLSDGSLRQVEAAKSLSKTLTAFANSTNHKFPFVTLPLFEDVLASISLPRVSGGTGARAISFNPVIDTSVPGLRAKWEGYVNSTTSSANTFNKQPNIINPPPTCTATCPTTGQVPGSCVWGVNRGIYSKAGSCNQPALFTDASSSSYPHYLTPVWQIAPFSNSDKNFKAVMFNLHSETVRRTALDMLYSTKSRQITSLIQLVQDSASVRPSGIIFEPVMGSDALSSTVVGTVSVVFSWDSIFVNAVSQELCVVLSSSCTSNCGSLAQTWTFTLSGARVVTEGPGDLHDASYAIPSAIISVDVGENVKYKLYVYPSKAHEARFRSNRPIVFCVVSIIIVFASMSLYLLYDHLMQRQRKALLYVASRSTRLVDSLFPKSLQNAVFRRQDEQNEADAAEANDRAGLGQDDGDDDGGGDGRPELALDDAKAQSKLRQFFTLLGTKSGGGGKAAMATADKKSNVRSAPIVAYFPDTTLFFSDIVGFTSWCSTRTASETFHMLESFFDAFDSIARKRGVFKIETVGDSWVGACGLPIENPDHAHTVACFAHEILAVFEMVKLQLAPVLGQDVLNLGIRIGLNSGGITGGVLRGERGRFQLFGDVINTASRMESNSVAGMVHASEETAARLRAAGLETWLEKRKGQLDVKGKGLMTTYWVTPPPEELQRLQLAVWGRSRYSQLFRKQIPGRPPPGSLTRTKSKLSLIVEGALDWAGGKSATRSSPASSPFKATTEGGEGADDDDDDDFNSVIAEGAGI